MISNLHFDAELQSIINECENHVKQIIIDSQEIDNNNNQMFKCKIKIIILENIEMNLTFHSGNGWKIIDIGSKSYDGDEYFSTLHQILMKESKLYMKSFHNSLSEKLLSSKK